MIKDNVIIAQKDFANNMKINQIVSVKFVILIVKDLGVIYNWVSWIGSKRKNLSYLMKNHKGNSFRK